MIDKNYYTLKNGIPENSKSNKIGMDTLHEKEGIHFWIIGKCIGEATDGRTIMTVQLSRTDARHLIEEITERIF